jgi:putative transposase
MTQPRRITAGMTVMVTRRTLRRTHLLRPDRKLTALFTYALAVFAHRHGILVHAAVVMSTHEHLVITDTRGNLPRFLRDFHRVLALGIKVLRKWEGAVWDHEKTSVVELCTPAAIVEKIAYVMANPVAAGLVPHAAQWPGITTAPEQLGKVTWSAPRPDYFFDRDNGLWPDVAALQLAPPPVDELSAEDVIRAVRLELDDLERQAQAEVRARGWTFLGPHKLRSLSPFARARSWEPLRARNPTFAVGRHCAEALARCAARLRAFRDAYRAAFAAWRAGARHVLFPHGTWLMSIFHGAGTAPP